jgi:hypothetical protein
MLLLSDLPHDVLKKILKQYLKKCNGAPILWRLVCRELRSVAAEEDPWSRLQSMAVSVGLVRMMRLWIRDGMMGGSQFRMNPMQLWAAGAGRVWESDLLKAVVRHNDAAVLVEILQDGWAKRTGLTLVTNRNQTSQQTLCCDAAAAGALDSFKVLLHHGLPMDAMTCQWAVEYGHLDVVKWHLEVDKKYHQLGLAFSDRAHGKTCEWRFPHPVRGRGHCSMDLVKQHTPLQVWYYLVEKAVRHGHLHIVTLLLPMARRSEGSELFDGIASLAAECGHLNILKWVAAQMEDAFPDVVGRAFFEASYNGHVEILKWMYPTYTEGWIDYDTVMMNNKANLEVVQWLVEEAGMELTPETMFRAMEGYERTGDFAVMDYLHSKKCPKVHSHLWRFDDEFQCAANLRPGAKTNVMEWLCDHDYPLPALRGEEAMREAMIADVVSVVAGLHALGVAFDAQWYGSADYYKYFWDGHEWDKREVVRWARNNGFDVREAR